MNNEHVLKISQELTVKEWQVAATVVLLDEGATVPFVARYRKEATGSLDEVAITTIRDRSQQLLELDKRREAILKSLQERGKLTDELKESILKAETMSVLEDIYLPYRPKRRTRATIAREKGLEPLASLIFAQEGVDPLAEALGYVDTEKGVKDAEDALAGARDIIAEWVNDDQAGRAKMRELFELKGTFRSKAVSDSEEEGLKYKDYFDWEEPVASAPSHRVLALRRGEKEGFLSLRTTPPEEEALETLMSLFVKGDGADSQQVRLAIHDSYKRLLSVSMETEIRLATKKRADEDAIKVFAENLRQLLLAPPLGQKTVLAIDPGFRTGCKVVCMDRQGKLLHNDTIYPHQSERQTSEAANKIRTFCQQYEINAIAIGNGTAGRETEAFVRGLALPDSIQTVLVNESGASVYSASEVAREEFPDHDVTVRGAVSIGRRLMDPLAELVKIDPKSIGVGQYQHDVDQGALKRSLDDVVVSCVNAVGVEVNTASKQLLTYVSGLGPQLAARIVEYRQANGPFRAREDFKKVSKLGPKAFEQAAGFLRIREAENPLDASAVHPESYKIVYAIADDLKCSVSDLVHNADISKLVDIRKYVTDTVGVPTLTDILEELAKPGRDPRQQFESIRFHDEVKTIEDVKPGMSLPGIITNITAFGVFVDIGVHQDGLVHISQLADRYVKNPTDVVKVQQKVNVTVLEVDTKRKRISLSMKKQKG
ncbi:MAG: RNA-binding transcriptional accessory protein [Nitrospirae bacterium]|nr:RNA-binding transcriptional accessory protein [Nitrospirota bacterium]